MAQKHAAMLQQQRAIAAAGIRTSPLQASFGGNGRGVATMMGKVSGVGMFGANSPVMAAWC
jgi:hypothetical protein